jgi:hypothetical protein
MSLGMYSTVRPAKKPTIFVRSESTRPPILPTTTFLTFCSDTIVQTDVFENRIGAESSKK